MKLRMRGNALRLRLTRSEVEHIGAGGSVVETTAFPDGTRLAYELSPGSAFAAEQIPGDSGTTIRVTVPTDQAEHWAGSEEVGLTGQEPFQVGPLQVLIEKDFTCITPREGEEEIDTYPNPNAVAG